MSGRRALGKNTSLHRHTETFESRVRTCAATVGLKIDGERLAAVLLVRLLRKQQVWVVAAATVGPRSRIGAIVGTDDLIEIVVKVPIIELPRTCYRFDTHVRRQAAALRLEVSNVFGTIQEIDDLAKS